MLVPRSRTQSHGISSGIYHRSTTTPDPITRNNQSTTCDDVVGGFGLDNAFLLDRDRISGGFLNGTVNAGFLGDLTWSSVPFNVSPSGDPNYQFQENAANAALKARNRTNPGRPKMLAAASLAELRDLPRLIRDIESIARRTLNLFTQHRLNKYERFKPRIDKGYTIREVIDMFARLNLAEQFAFAPMIDDLKKIGGLSESIQARKKELNRLHSGNGLKRRVTLDKRRSTSQADTIIWSRDARVFRVRAVTDYGIDRWATVRYKPTKDSPLPSDDLSIGLLLTGLTLNSLASTIWELIPWSWMVDYFTNIGDIVESTNNSAHVQCTSCCVMSHRYRRIVSNDTNLTSSGSDPVKASTYTRITETKQRMVGMPPALPDIGLPILSGAQLSILGSIAVTRARR